MPRKTRIYKNNKGSKDAGKKNKTKKEKAKSKKKAKSAISSTGHAQSRKPEAVSAASATPSTQ